MGKEKKQGTWKDVWGFLKVAKLSKGSLFLAILVYTLYGVLAAVVVGDVSSLFDGNFAVSRLFNVIGKYALLLVCNYFSSLLTIVAREKSLLSARKNLWRHMMKVQSSYYDKTDSSVIMTTVTSDVQQAMTNLIAFVTGVPAVVIFIIMIGTQLNPKLMIVVYITVGMFIVYWFISGRYIYRASRSIQIEIGELSGYLADRMRNHLLIKSFAMEKREKQLGEEISEKLYGAKKRNAFQTGLNTALPTAISSVGFILTVVVGVHYLNAGEITTVELLTLFISTPMMLSFLAIFSVLWMGFKSFEGQVYRICRMMEAPVESDENARSEVPEKGDLKFEHVGFAYREGKQILNDVSFTIPRGKITALIGRTGCGKSTCLKLLERLYDYQNGSIWIGDVEIKDLNRHNWRQKFSYVSQESLMFGGNVRTALTYGIKREVSEEEMAKAAKITGIYDYIMEKCGGFDGELAGFGTSMSGGQRQRFVITREIIKNADFLIFDEPTSALDAEIANEIRKLIFEQFSDKTVILVTHELNMITQADKIIMLGGGAVLGEGDHKKLLASCKPYQELVEEQYMKKGAQQL